MATSFPTSIDTAATLFDAVNNAESTLSAGYTAGGTTLDLASAALFPSTGGIIYVGNERTTYTGKSSNQLTGVTGLSNNYSSGTAVAMYVDAEHHNALRGAIVAIESRVGETGSTTAGTLTKRIADLEAGSATTAQQIHAASAKATPEDTDEIGITDNAGSWALKKTTWAQVKAVIKTYFDTLYQAAGSYAASGAVTSSGLTQATARLLGRTTASTGAIEEISAGDGVVLESGIISTRIPQNSQSAAYTLVSGDAGKHILHPSADTTARTFTIPANSSVAYPLGTALSFVNQNGAGTVTIAITTDTMRLAGAGTTGSRTLAANGVATALKIASTEWIISGTGLT